MNAVVIFVLVTVGIGSTAFAQQQRSVRDMMNDMKARYGQTFEECQALAVSRALAAQAKRTAANAVRLTAIAITIKANRALAALRSRRSLTPMRPVIRSCHP